MMFEVGLKAWPAQVDPPVRPAQPPEGRRALTGCPDQDGAGRIRLDAVLLPPLLEHRNSLHRGDGHRLACQVLLVGSKLSTQFCSTFLMGPCLAAVAAPTPTLCSGSCRRTRQWGWPLCRSPRPRTRRRPCCGHTGWQGISARAGACRATSRMPGPYCFAGPPRRSNDPEVRLADRGEGVGCRPCSVDPLPSRFKGSPDQPVALPLPVLSHVVLLVADCFAMNCRHATHRGNHGPP
jgi:hypothetical protein